MKFLFTISFSLLVFSTLALTYVPEARLMGEDIAWETNFAEALKKAKKENKKLFLNFTGSDWCGWCIRLDKEVFSKEDFVTYAKGNFICVKLDFPKRKVLAEEEQKQNRDLAMQYKIAGFPTILVLDTEKNVLMTTGYQFGGVQAYIDHLTKGLDKK